MQDQFRDAATRRALLREAAFREARAARTARHRLLSANPLYEDPILGPNVYSGLLPSSTLPPPSLGLGVSTPSLGAGILPTAGIRTAAYPGALPLSTGAIAQREHTIQNIASEEALLAASRAQAHRKLALEEALLAASRDQRMRTIAHEEAMLAASRDQTLRILAQEEAILINARERSLQNLNKKSAGIGGLAAFPSQNLAIPNANGALRAASQNRAVPTTIHNNITPLPAVTHIKPTFVNATMPTGFRSAITGEPAISEAVHSNTKAGAVAQPESRDIVHNIVEEEAMFAGMKLRKGKFTPIEEVFGDALIDLFESGLVDAEKGTPLVAFLAKALHCSESRVTKKVAGKGRNWGTYKGKYSLPVTSRIYQYHKNRFHVAKEKFMRVLDTERGKTKHADQGAEQFVLTSSNPDTATVGDTNTKQCQQESSKDKIDNKLFKHQLQQLADYYREHGAGKEPVQKKYRQLRDFVHQVRWQHRERTLSPKQIAQLNGIGFDWSKRPRVPFEARLNELRAFRKKFGHCKVPVRYDENPSLGLWASNMRARYNSARKGKIESSVVPLTVKQIHALNEIGFEWELRFESQAKKAAFPKLQTKSQVALANQTQIQRRPVMKQPKPKIGQMSQTREHSQPPRVHLRGLPKSVKRDFWCELERNVVANLGSLNRKYEMEEFYPSPIYRIPLEQRSVGKPPPDPLRSDDSSSTEEEDDHDDFPNIEEDLSDDEYYEVVANLKRLDMLYQEEAAAVGEKKSLVQQFSTCESLSRDEDFSDDEYRNVKKKLKALDRKYKQAELEDANEDGVKYDSGGPGKGTSPGRPPSSAPPVATKPKRTWPKDKPKRFWRKPKDKPKRPLTAYNYFFKHERSRILEGREDNPSPQEIVCFIEKYLSESPEKNRHHRRTHGKIGFRDLARKIAEKWKNVDKESKAVFDHYANLEIQRYRREIAAWKIRKKQEALSATADEERKRIHESVFVDAEDEEEDEPLIALKATNKRKRKRKRRAKEVISLDSDGESTVLGEDEEESIRKVTDKEKRPAIVVDSDAESTVLEEDQEESIRKVTGKETTSLDIDGESSSDESDEGEWL